MNEEVVACRPLWHRPSSTGVVDGFTHPLPTFIRLVVEEGHLSACQFVISAVARKAGIQTEPVCRWRTPISMIPRTSG